MGDESSEGGEEDDDNDKVQCKQSRFLLKNLLRMYMKMFRKLELVDGGSNILPKMKTISYISAVTERIR